MENESLNLIWPILTGGLIMPLVQCIKKYLPGDFPVQPIFYSLALALLVAWGMTRWLAPGMSLEDCLIYVIGSNFGAQLVHATFRTAKKYIANRARKVTL